MRARPLLAALVAVAATCAACTGSSTPGAGPTAPAASPGASTGSPTATGVPSPTADPVAEGAVVRTAEYYGPNSKSRRVVLTVHPAVRTQGRLFVTIDLSPQGDQEATGSDWFCTAGTLCDDMAAISLVDTARAVRYGPLLRGPGSTDVLSSRSPLVLQAHRTYRYGVFFADPAGAPSTVDLELLYAGPVLGLPVVEGDVPAEQLGGPAPTPDASGDRVVLPVAEPGADARPNGHPLALPVVGGALAEGSSGDRSVVTLPADVLFAFGRAELSPPARAVLSRAAGVLAAKADTTRPVQVVGHTDSKGSPAANVALSLRRAAAVVAAVRQDPRLRGLRVQASGKGESDPVAPNSTPQGTDDPHGRALNRRVEISYLPKQVAATPGPTSAPTPAPTTEGTAAAGAVTVRAASVVSGGAGSTAMSAVVDPVVRRGRLSVVQVHLTQANPTGGFDYFALGRGDRDAGRWSIVLPATKALLRPAADVDRLGRPLTGRINGMDGGRPYRVDLWTAAVPAGTTTVDVDLGQLGVAHGVPVTG